MNRRVFLLGVAAAAVPTAGCGPGKVQVSGRLEWADGKPAVELADGQVIFDSPGTRTSARGVIGKDGTFRIDTQAASDGVMPGDYQVAIVEHRPAPEGATRLPPQHLPDKYYSFDTSGLKATVAAGQEVVLKLDRMPAKK